MYKRKNKTFWPAVSLGLLALLALVTGCSQSPTEAPTSTIISGYDSLWVAPGDYPFVFYFKNGSTTYGNIQLWLMSDEVFPHILQLRILPIGCGIQLGTGNVAPDSGYSNEYSLYNSLIGQSFFIKTDIVPHYGKITWISRRDPADASGYTFIGFQWIVQTVAGKRELY